MVEKNKKPRTSRYVYGNTAYDLEVQRKTVKEEKVSQVPKPKKRKSKKKYKIKLKIISSVAMIFIMAFIVVGRYTTILTLSNEVRSEKQEIQNIQKENANIKVELAKLNNLEEIKNIATSKYGMIKPTKDVTYYLSVKPLGEETKDNKKSALTKMQRILGLIY